MTCSFCKTALLSNGCRQCPLIEGFVRMGPGGFRIPKREPTPWPPLPGDQVAFSLNEEEQLQCLYLGFGAVVRFPYVTLSGAPLIYKTRNIAKCMQIQWDDIEKAKGRCQGSGTPFVFRLTYTQIGDNGRYLLPTVD